MSTTALSTTPAPGSVSKTGIILANMDEIWRFAETVIASGMAPKGISNASAATITIQMGMELGLPPMAALQNIANINGRPSIWGDAMLGVVRSTGELEEFTEWYELNGTRLPRTPLEFPDALMAVCRIKRHGYDAIESSFSVADAKRAKLWGKQGPWTEYTARMLKFRARSFGLRDEFGDALRGLYSAEEQRDAPNEMRDVTPRSTTPPKVITGGTAPEETQAKATRKPAAQAPAEVVTEASASMPSRDEMSAVIKGRMKELKIGLPVTETRLREAGLLKNGQTMVKTTDEELYKISQNLDALNPPSAGTEAAEPAIIHAFYENHQVTNSPEGAERKWTCWRLRYTPAGEDNIREAVTFSSTIGDLLDSLEGAEAIILTVKTTEKGDQIETFELAAKLGGEA
jgi:hypothetical protein